MWTEAKGQALGQLAEPKPRDRAQDIMRRNSLRNTNLGILNVCEESGDLCA